MTSELVRTSRSPDEAGTSSADLPRSLAPRQRAETFDELSEEEKHQLKQSLEDLTRDTPRTAVAESRFKRLVKKAGSDAYEGMRSILVEIVSETVKKSLFGG